MQLNLFGTPAPAPRARVEPAAPAATQVVTRPAQVVSSPSPATAETVKQPRETGAARSAREAEAYRASPLGQRRHELRTTGTTSIPLLAVLDPEQLEAFTAAPWCTLCTEELEAGQVVTLANTDRICQECHDHEESKTPESALAAVEALEEAPAPVDSLTAYQAEWEADRSAFQADCAKRAPAAAAAHRAEAQAHEEQRQELDAAEELEEERERLPRLPFGLARCSRCSKEYKPFTTLQVPCSSCKAEPGQVCRTPSGKPTGFRSAENGRRSLKFHKRRRELYSREDWREDGTCGCDKDGNCDPTRTSINWVQTSQIRWAAEARSTEQAAERARTWPASQAWLQASLPCDECCPATSAAELFEAGLPEELNTEAHHAAELAQGQACDYSGGYCFEAPAEGDDHCPPHRAEVDGFALSSIRREAERQAKRDAAEAKRRKVPVHVAGPKTWDQPGNRLRQVCNRLRMNVPTLWAWGVGTGETMAREASLDFPTCGSYKPPAGLRLVSLAELDHHPRRRYELRGGPVALPFPTLTEALEFLAARLEAAESEWSDVAPAGWAREAQIDKARRPKRHRPELFTPQAGQELPGYLLTEAPHTAELFTEAPLFTDHPSQLKG